MSVLWVLAVPLLYTVSNLIDKFQLNHDSEDCEPKVLMALSSVFSLIVIIPVGIWVVFSKATFGDWGNILPLFFNEILYVSGILIFLMALKLEESSRVIPWFQTIPIFGLVGAWTLLGEWPGNWKIVAMVFLALGGFILAFRNGKMNGKVVIMMLFSSAFMATYDTIFAKYGREMDNAPAILINLIGKTVWPAFFLLNSKIKRGFILGLKTQFKLQAASGFTTLVADITLCLFVLYFPVMIVQAGCCLQPLFVFVAGTILTKVNSKIACEEIGGLTLAQKAIGIGLMVIGGIVLSV